MHVNKGPYCNETGKLQKFWLTTQSKRNTHAALNAIRSCTGIMLCHRNILSVLSRKIWVVKLRIICHYPQSRYWLNGPCACANFVTSYIGWYSVHRKSLRNITYRQIFGTGTVPIPLLPRDATQSAVMTEIACRPSVCPSVCLSVCDVYVPWSNRLEFFERDDLVQREHPQN